MADDLHARLYEAIDTDPLLVIGIVETALAERDAEMEGLRRRVEHLRERNAELQDLELGIKSLTTSDGSVDMSLHMAHDMMRILVAGFVTILDAEGGPNYAEMMFSLRDTTDQYTLTIRRPDGKTPAEVASEQRRRAELAEAATGRVRALAERMAALAPADDWGDTIGDTAVADAARTVLAALDHPTEETTDGR